MPRFASVARDVPRCPLQPRRPSLGDASCIAVAERLRLPMSGDDSYWSLLPLSVDFHPFRGI